MKKIKLLLLATIISTLCHAQSYNKVYKSSMMEYRNSEWVSTYTQYPQKMFVILKDSEVTITNEAETKIITYGKAEIINQTDGKMMSWSAYDKNGKDCTFIMRTYYNSSDVYFTIAYLRDNICFSYYTNND